MKAFLDTSGFLWFIVGNNRLSREAREVMEDFEAVDKNAPAAHHTKMKGVEK